ncbi:MAG: exosortase system-associated protein, TIGR04073 family [Candidatus Omnitrophica bacterium]|nr:exosortase system-associated protein, TIGR04073 family [Candidatus Omnitrophota bacterium]
MRTYIGLLMGLAIGVTASAAWADESGPMRKLGRGAANIAYGMWELPIQIVEVRNRDGAVAATTLGVIKGLSAVFQRTFVGLYEVLTFPFPQPMGSYEPIITPEFVNLRK